MGRHRQYSGFLTYPSYLPGTELLDLRICDLAMGSGAFLVASCRYLAKRLLEAWQAEGLGPGDWLALPSALQGHARNNLDRVLMMTRHSSTVMLLFAPTGLIYSDATNVFAYDDDAHLGLLTSAFHYSWAVSRASTIGAGIRYTPTDCFETVPQPELTDDVGKIGGALDGFRRQVMVVRCEGLTKVYNRVHNRGELAADITELRRLHVELDHAVADAYGWEDLDLDHGFHETRQGVRYTIGPEVRGEVVDRLLELNHDRYVDEVRRGLHDRGPRRCHGGPRAALNLCSRWAGDSRPGHGAVAS